jgi:hypothetical protein
LIFRIAGFGLLLAVLAAIVWQVPVLWELALVVAIGGIYGFSSACRRKAIRPEYPAPASLRAD